MVNRVRSSSWRKALRLLSRKERAAPAITPIFDGEKEARLVALACSTPLKAVRAGRCGFW